MSVIDRMQPRGKPAYADRLLAEAARAANANRMRIAAAAADLATMRAETITEETRVDLARLLAGVIAVVEDDLRQGLIEQVAGDVAADLTESLGAGELAIAAPILDRAGVLGDADLVAVLLRRVETRRLADRLRPTTAPQQPLVETLLQSGDEPLAAMAMAMIVARSRQSRSVDSASPASTGLPAELQYRIVWRVAAALRHHILSRGAMSQPAVDRALTFAAQASLAGYDEDDTLEGRAMQLARRLHQRRRLDDALIVRAVDEGEPEIAVAAIAARASIDFASAWDMAGDRGGNRLTVLLRASNVARPAAARIIGAVIGAEIVAVRIDAFDLLDPQLARESLRPWQADPGYRRAIAEIACGQLDDIWR